MADAASMKLEEKFDTWVCRPLGVAIAKACLKTSITPNQVTVVAGFFGMLAGVGYYFASPYPALGSLALFVMMVLDCTDGDLARMRGGGDWRGRMIDGIADFVTAVSVHLGMLLYLVRAQPVILGYRLGGLELFLIALLAGASMSWNSGVVDGLKQQLKESSIDRDVERHRADVKGPIDWVLFQLLKHYSSAIASSGDKRFPGGYATFKLAQWVGPTHHHLAIVLGGFLVLVHPLAYLAYFAVALVPMNVFLAFVLLRAQRLERASPAAETTSRA